METNTNEFIPRMYQVELFEAALKENAIVYLPTGAGKTFIATMLIKALSGDIQKPYDEGGKHTVFVVNTVPLVQQQSEYIQRITGFSCAALSGDVGIDFWKNAEWNIMLTTHRVLVMTPQILVNALSFGYMLLNQINLIIFDECHRAVNDHPMRQIMQYFEHCPKNEQPRILGLSASLLNSNVKLEKIQSIIQSLEITLNAKVITTKITLKEYYATPNEQIVEFDEYVIPNVGQSVINTIMEMQEILGSINLRDNEKYMESSAVFRPKSINVKLGNIIKDIQEQFSNTGIYGVCKSMLLHLIQLECLKKFATDEETVCILEVLITEVNKCKKLLEDEMKDNTEIKKIYNYSSDRVLQLFTILKNCYYDRTDGQKFCCIIFVQRRFTAQVLYHVLKNLAIHDENYKFLRPEFVVGFSNDPFKNSREVLCIAKWNKEALRRFRNGLSNCIVATDILDEGVDIPKCMLIIRYNLPMDVRTYIQSKGRARYKFSQYTLLVPKNDIQYLKRYNDFKVTEKYLQLLLTNKTNERNMPSEHEIQNELYQHNIKPFIVIGRDGQKRCVTEQIAISLINQYCASLLKSKFVYLSPIWILYTNSENARDKTSKKSYQVSVKLPIVSPLKTVIFGDFMDNVTNAKRSVAMKTCVELHRIGELTDTLTPNTVDTLLQDSCNLFPNWIDENESEKSIIGTTKKKRHHQLQYPSALNAAFPLPLKTTYLHILHAKPKYPVPHHDNRHLVFYNLLLNASSFGILSAKEMPEVPSFPIFMNVGELNVDVKVNYTTVHLCEQEIGFAKVFHTLIFSEIVPIIKTFMVFDNYNLDNCFLIVPVDRDWNINWEVIKQCKSIERIPPPFPFRFNVSDYEQALVIPNYRTADTYIVTKVCDDITPNSCFPTENFFTYAHYYKEKHGLDINNLRQPMLEVKTISRTIDFITPRCMQSESKKRRYADLPKNLKEHLVPELCTRINFPSLYWLKATMLPSILHRISQLLIAEDLRYTIALETNLGLLTNNTKWPPLIITEEEKEEPFVASLEISTSSENVDTTQSEPTINGPEIDVLNTDDNHYPWSKHEEPPDLFRNAEEIQLIQIEHYYQFMCEKDDENYKTVRNKIIFINKPSVQVLPLRILSLNNSCGPDPVQVMYALTTKLGHDAFNLERLETLGDSYLKFITSLFLYHQFPTYSEGPLTALKGKILGNRNLYYCAVQKSIPGRIKVDDFIPLSNFIAPAYTVFRELQALLLDAEVSPSVLYEIQIPENEQFDGHITETTKYMMQQKILNWETAESQTGMEHYLGMQSVSDKTVADCVEALLGVYLNSMGIKDTVSLLKWFKILPNDIDVSAILFGSPANPLISGENIDFLMPWASDIETKLGYKFENRAYLLQAFTHPSYTANCMTECYQRLEFLGDAIIDFLLTCYIYENCGNLNPGALTDLRSALVNNITFACLTVRHGLHTALLSYAPNLNDIIHRFVKFQEERNHTVNDELLWILLEENECNMVEHVDVPKVLGDLFESTIGAIYLDSNKNLRIVWETIYSIMHKEIDEFSKNIPKQPIRVLYETQGARPQFLNASVVENTNMIMVPLKVTIAGKVKIFHGFGANKKQAKCAAAKQALKSFFV